VSDAKPKKPKWRITGLFVVLAVCLGLIGGGVAGVVWWLKNTELPGDGLPAIVDHTSAPPAPGPEFDTPSAHMFNRIVQEFSALPLEEAAGLLVRDLDKSGSPSLCHGVAGGALVLDLAGRQLRRPDWRETASDLVARGGATLSRCPWMWGKHDVRDFGIMTGPGRWRRTAPAGPGTHRWYGRYGMRIVLQQSEQDCLLAC